MLSMGYTICIIVVCAFCTFAERLLPFLIFRKGSVPNLVRYLGNILPVAVMELWLFTAFVLLIFLPGRDLCRSLLRLL